MRKGFTLIELLIVMVIVGILVTVALPKYNASLQRGRVMEALANLKTASGMMNAGYVINEGAYTRNQIADNLGNFIAGDFTASVSFKMPVIVSDTDNVVEIEIATVDGADDAGKLVAYNEDGELKYITCTLDDRVCEAMGAELDTSVNPAVYRIDFRLE